MIVNFPCRRLLLYPGFLECLLPTSGLFIQQAISHPLTPLIPHCVQQIVSLKEKNVIRSLLLKSRLFIQQWKKCNEEFASKITSFYSTMKKCDKNFAPKIMSFYTITKKNAMRSLLQKLRLFIQQWKNTIRTLLLKSQLFTQQWKKRFKEWKSKGEKRKR